MITNGCLIDIILSNLTTCIQILIMKKNENRKIYCLLRYITDWILIYGWGKITLFLNRCFSSFFPLDYPAIHLAISFYHDNDNDDNIIYIQRICKQKNKRKVKI